MKQVEIRTEDYKVEKDDDGYRIKGLALPFNTESKNGVNYNKDSCIEASETMVGKSLLWNHDESQLPLGKVDKFEEGEYDGREGMVYEAEVDPEEEEAVRKLERGYISNVSIRAYIDEDSVENDEVWVESFGELSLVNIAGFDETNVMSMQQFQEKYMNDSKSEQEKNSEGDNVTEEKEKEQEVEEPQEEPQEESEVTEQSDLSEKVEELAEKVDQLSERMSALEEQIKAEEDDDEDDEDDEEEKCDDDKDDEEEAVEKEKAPVQEKPKKSFKQVLKEVRRK